MVVDRHGTLFQGIEMYLYQFEDGTICQCDTPPTDEDNETIADGILQVIRFVDGQFFDMDEHGQLTPIGTAKLCGKKSRQFHIA